MRVVIADDEMLLREGLARLLADAGFEIAGRCGDADSLLRMVQARRPDVAIVDIRMPPGRCDDGLLAAQEIRRRIPTSASSCSPTTSTRGTRRDCSRRCPSAPATCSRSASRTSPSSPTRCGASTRASAWSTPPSCRGSSLASVPGDRSTSSPSASARCSALVAEGHSNGAIGERLFLSRKTVDAHISRIFAKLDLAESPQDNRRVLAVIAFLRSA